MLFLLLMACSSKKATAPEDDSDLSSSSVVLDSVDDSTSSIVKSSSGGVSSSSGILSSSSVVNTSPISLYKLGAMARTVNNINEMTALPYSIELDTITQTASFYFIIKNTLTTDIRNLQFTFDLPYFKITPDSIVVLSAPTVATGMEQLIKVTVEHGTLATGLGNADVLFGNQYATLTISGTSDEGDFSIDYTMHVFAKRMLIYLRVPADSLPNPIGVTENRYIEVDSTSLDCYLDYETVTIDTSINITYDATHYNDTSSFDYYTDPYYQSIQNYTSPLLNESPQDRNCVTEVITDQYKLTQPYLSQNSTTIIFVVNSTFQYFID